MNEDKEIQEGFTNLKSFKNELRLVTSDTWGSAMDAWFECAGHMHNKGIKIPEDWDYSTGASGDGTEEDNYFYELFLNTDNEMLIEIGSFLFRYCQYLKFKGLDY